MRRAEYLRRATQAKQKPPVEIERAWTELYIAEGSDWFWWFGDSHSSAQDALFDRLFRKHLQNVYTILGDAPPGELARPISQGQRAAHLHTQPSSLLNVTVDGRRTYFEWINAGRWLPSGSRGTMSMVQEGRLAAMYFGFDAERLCLRFDARGGPARERLADIETLRIVFVEPAGFELLISHPNWQEPIVQLYHNDVAVSESGVEAAAAVYLEVAIPFRSLALSTDDPVHFYVELLQGEQAIDRAPTEGAIETTVPSPEFENMMWQA